MPKFIEQYTGKEYEYDAYGECLVNPEMRNVMKDIFDKWNKLDKEEKHKYNKLHIIKLIIKNYEGDPYNPKAPLANKLLQLLSHEMDLESHNFKLAFYSSLDTPIDRMHIDGFFVLDDNPELIVTTDITLKDEKDDYVPDEGHVVMGGDLLRDKEGGETEGEYVQRVTPHVQKIKQEFFNKIRILDKLTKRR